jgi:hypothetical protein
VVALGLCTLPAGFGVPWWVVLPVGAAVLIGGLMLLGTPLEADREATPPAATEEASERTAASVS